MASREITLFTGRTTPGLSPKITPEVDGPIDVVLVAWGTFGGGSVVLHQIPNDGNILIPVSGVLTANGRSVFKLVHDGALRAELVAGGGPYNVNVKLFGVSARPETIKVP